MSTQAYDGKEGRIVFDGEDQIAMIGIDRPAKLNGFNPKMLIELAQAYTTFERDDAFRAAVLYAVGDNFTAGLELDKVVDYMRGRDRLAPEGTIDPFGLHPPIRSKPLVTAVQGYCYTLGIEVMLAGDYVVAAEGTRFSQLEVKRGIMATGGATIRMVERAGWARAMRHLLSGDEFGTDEALACDFVQEVVPKGRQIDRAKKVAREIAAQAPLAVRATLANARKALYEGRAAAIGEMRAVQSELMASEDAKEGLRAFLERRDGNFAGR